MFSYEPALSQQIDDPEIGKKLAKIQAQVGDISQPWHALGRTCNISPFSAKALFVFGVMHRYFIAANAVLKEMRFQGFPFAYSLLSSSIELLGRCTHIDKWVRQHPLDHSMERLTAGFDYIKISRLQSNAIIETNHYPDMNDGYTREDLKHLRNLVVHGGCLANLAAIKGDIELVHQLRKAIYGVPIGETDPHDGSGPIKGAIDRYFEELSSGHRVRCEQLATSAIISSPLQLQQGSWRYDVQVIDEIRQHITDNIALGRFPISGGHQKSQDYFQLYP